MSAQEGKRAHELWNAWLAEESLVEVEQHGETLLVTAPDDPQTKGGEGGDEVTGHVLDP